MLSAKWWIANTRSCLLVIAWVEKANTVVLNELISVATSKKIPAPQIYKKRNLNNPEQPFLTTKFTECGKSDDFLVKYAHYVDGNKVCRETKATFDNAFLVVWAEIWDLNVLFCPNIVDEYPYISLVSWEDLLWICRAHICFLAGETRLC